MPDILSPEQRSERMARVKSRGNVSTEIALARAFRRSGIHGWRRHVRVSMDEGHCADGGGRRAEVRPDFVFRDERLVVFVDGCFWHACPRHRTTPKNNRDYWATKLRDNQRRDRRVSRALKREGWLVIRVWEHDVRGRLEHVVMLMRRRLRESRCRP
jgi:DNA mismatch endonuclease (patch repair protein)